MFAITLCGAIAYAQPPQGGGMGDRPPGGGGGRPPMGQMKESDNESFLLEKFPDIPDLSLEQREKVGSLLLKEHKAVSKKMAEKRDLLPRPTRGEQREIPDPEKIEKNRKKLEKLDENIEKIREKTNKKVKKVLSSEQYQVFLDVKDSFVFKRQARSNNFMQRPNARGNDNMGAPPMLQDGADFE